MLRISRLSIQDTLPDGSYRTMSFQYGPDCERWYSELADDGVTSRSTVYAGNYEKVTENGVTREFNYLDSVCHMTPGARYFTEAEKEAYSTVGGAQHLYGEYTIYGEVISGLEVIDKIAELETNMADRPKTDVRMKIRIIQ